MNKQNPYSKESIEEISLITDFLPYPKELALKKENTKVTISLSSESVAYFKDTSKKYSIGYQLIIRELLDEYVEYQKSAIK